MTTIENIKELFEQSVEKEKQGESLILQSLVNYVEGKLGLIVVKAESKETWIEIIAKLNLQIKKKGY